MPQTEAAQSLSAAVIRQQFLDFFTEKHGHTFAPSSPVVPHDDPTLLFTNAGMNQFKDVFLGQGSRPYTRAVNSQKCIRAGGKHNDLEDVGKDTYHHTFFEMLGNWSFGDYFKREAILWAWQLLTEVWGLDKSRLYVTVFEGDKEDGLEADEEAAKLWAELTDIDPSHISRWGKKDNFWEMGDTGPCGPCSEIHYDSTPNGNGGHLVNKDDPNVIEIWNLVFIQFNRAPGKGGKPGKLTPLPAKHVDTGMGFERITRVLQGKTSNYDTDIWSPIFDAIQQKTGAKAYGASLDDAGDITYRVIADHIRCLTIAITDGATPSNEGRGYVLRRILRRAVRIARQTLGVQGPVLCELVPAVVDTLGDAFPELKKNPQRVADVIKQEELAFLKTIDRGIEHFGTAALRAASPRASGSHGSENRGTTTTHGSESRGTTMISAEDAFKLHDTYGFPIDLTQVMAEERGMTVDVAGFEQLMEQAREKSRAGGEAEETFTLTPNAIAELKRQNVEPTDDHYKYAGYHGSGYHGSPSRAPRMPRNPEDARLGEPRHHIPRPLPARIEAIWNGTDFDNVVGNDRRVAIILDRTNHYAEQGGQVGDAGTLTREYGDGAVPAKFQVESTQAVGGYVMHIGRVTNGRIRVKDRITAQVERKQRSLIQANHTATHLLNFALREVLGEDVQQKGSLVAADRLRFDFSSIRAMKHEEIERVERIVNEQIAKSLTVHADLMSLEQAMKIAGVRAVFGEKYPDPVRVVSIGAPVKELADKPEDDRWRQYSIEFCGGTHLADTDEANHFVIVSEQALAAGVRRITALTGIEAQAADIAGTKMLDRLAKAEKLEGDALVSEFDAIAGEVEHITTGAVLKHRIVEQLDSLREKVKAVRKAAQASNRDAVVEQARQIAEAHGRDAHATESGASVIVEQIDGADKDTLLAAIDVIKAKRPDSAIMLLSPDAEEGKVSIAAVVPKDLIAKGLKAGDWVREAAKACGGGGGGRPDMAQAGGKQPEKTADAMNVARQFAAEKLGS